MRISALAALAILWLVALMAPAARALDAGGFAFQQHQFDLQRQQSGIHGHDTEEDANEAGLPPDQRKALVADMKRLQEQARAELQPEYERRVAADGRDAANQWLTTQARARGEQAGRLLRKKYGLD
jgi:hypothetical protein